SSDLKYSLIFLSKLEYLFSILLLLIIICKNLLSPTNTTNCLALVIAVYIRFLVRSIGGPQCIGIIIIGNSLLCDLCIVVVYTYFYSSNCFIIYFTSFSSSYNTFI